VTRRSFCYKLRSKYHLHCSKRHSVQNEGDTKTSGSRPIRVAIIEDQLEVREGLAVLINGTPGFKCAGNYRTMEDALRVLEKDPSDVVLTDLGLPLMSGAQGIRILKQRHPDLPILALTVFNDDEEIFDALCAGASGYLLKNTPPARLLECLKEVINGGAPMSHEVARRVIRLFREISPPERATYRLTQQETELLKLIVEGHNYKAAAAKLGITMNTVSFHARNIYAKLQVHSKSAAVAKALRNRLI
jgi:DNA-binding NarL/FixJ family response regulator